jgi:hypothetical protein
MDRGHAGERYRLLRLTPPSFMPAREGFHFFHERMSVKVDRNRIHRVSCLLNSTEPESLPSTLTVSPAQAKAAMIC